jgi:hypothetical protein
VRSRDIYERCRVTQVIRCSCLRLWTVGLHTSVLRSGQCAVAREGRAPEISKNRDQDPDRRATCGGDDTGAPGEYDRQVAPDDACWVGGASGATTRVEIDGSPLPSALDGRMAGVHLLRYPPHRQGSMPARG